MLKAPEICSSQEVKGCVLEENSKAAVKFFVFLLCISCFPQRSFGQTVTSLKASQQSKFDAYTYLVSRPRSDFGWDEHSLNDSYSARRVTILS